MSARTYIAIDLKSFYASVECVERNRDPLTTNLVVADSSRTEKTICLAVSPSLKAYGIPGRARLFEVVQKACEVNAARRRVARGGCFEGKSDNAVCLKMNPALELDYIVAPPQMARYMQISAEIYGIYLKYISPEDIHVYSIDEVFIDATRYLSLYNLSDREFAMKLVQEVLSTTGITATAGIGTNLFLCKVAMDIVAKHIPADKNGVRIATLNEQMFRENLWTHRPLTDFWRIGHGYAYKLEAMGLHTMGDIAEMSVKNEDVLYRMFGVNAELLIDHAWGWESCTIADIKNYKPESNSISSGQVLKEAYSFDKCRLVVMEMADQLALDLFEKHVLTDRLSLIVGYDTKNLSDANRRQSYSGLVSVDRFGRQAPKNSHGTIDLGRLTSSAKIIVGAMMRLFDSIVDSGLLIRRLNVAAERVKDERLLAADTGPDQLDLFTDYEAIAKKRAEENAELEKERRLQSAIVDIKKKISKNALLKGVSLLDGATARERNNQIGGHRK